MNIKDIISKYLHIANLINDNGGKLYLVGGAVRDFLLGNTPHDLDFCVTGLSFDEFNNLFPGTRIQGKDFPVFIIDGNEFSLARTEIKIGQKHTDFEVLTDKSISIENDLARRDITINSIAIELPSGNIIDPFNGQKDLKNGVIRMTTNAFFEDALRAYRVSRFASTFGFSVEENTINAMRNMKDDLLFLSSERVFTEFRKALLSKHPSIFFDVLRKADILDVHFKEIYDLIGVEQPVLYHPEGDAYVHTLEVLERAALYTPNAQVGNDEELTRFCALVHDFGKGLTPKEEWPRHIGHEERGVLPIHNFCKRIKAPNIFEKAGKLTSLLHMKAGRFGTLKPSTKVKLFEDIYNSRSISFEGMEIVAKADSKDDSLSFAKLAHEVMNINATDDIIKMCTLDDGNLDFEKLKQVVHEKKVRYVKEHEKCAP